MLNTALTPPPLRTQRRSYHCVCKAAVYVRNSVCLNCQRQLGYEPLGAQMLALQPTELPGQWAAATVNTAKHQQPDLSENKNASVNEPSHGTGLYYRCANFATAAACNWLRPANIVAHGGDDGLCMACSLTRTLPDQALPANQVLWRRLEAAKRRLISQLLWLGLPVRTLQRSPWQDTQRGLAFDFLLPIQNAAPVITGHAQGVITINAQEADDSYREQTRNALHEPYRTLLGHLRHEIGHYYWDRLVVGTHWIEPFRAWFGDERRDYAQALKTHYAVGAPADWSQHYISAYASSHPWEDWAETWAHYLHMQDAMATALSFGFEANDVQVDTVPFAIDTLWDPHRPGAQAFLDFVNNWLRITRVLNELSRSMGEPDFYPFVLPRAAIAKLQLVHEVVSLPA